MSGGERIFTCCEVKGYSLYEGQRTLAIRMSKDTYRKEVKGYSHVMRSKIRKSNNLKGLRSK